MRCSGRVANLMARLEPERLVVAEDEVHQELHLAGDLILAQVDVAVVLCELPHARQARQRARQLVPVQHVERDVAQRQLAVRPPRRAVVQMMRRAVHGLEAHVVLVGLGVQHQEHVLPVLAPVARLFPQRFRVEERRLDFLECRLLP